MRFTPRTPKLERNWYAKLPNGEVRGPLHESHIKELLGVIDNPQALEVSKDQTTWCPASEHPDKHLLLPKNDKLQMGRTWSSKEAPAEPTTESVRSR